MEKTKETDEKVYTITVTEKERVLLLFAVGAASAMFYDGTHKHDDEDNQTFREFFKITEKLGVTKPAGPAV